jgi:hypothetical protein
MSPQMTSADVIAPAVSNSRLTAASDQLDACLEQLTTGSERLAMTPISGRLRLVDRIRQNVMPISRDWVNISARIKQTNPTPHLRSEEILSGPVVTARYLRLLRRTLQEIGQFGRPRLPGRLRHGADGRLLVPVAPVSGLFDRLAFMGFRAHARMRHGITSATLPDHTARCYQQTANNFPPRVRLVLGAGNITSVPVLDACDHIFAHGESVLLKLHPLHGPLQPLFETLLEPLVEFGCLRIITGDAEMGRRAIVHPTVDAIHITGGVDTHDSIVWGSPGVEHDQRRRLDQPLLKKPISAELGNVSPWIVLPGRYSRRQLDYQAENIASSVINNAGCNCVATRVLVTWREWNEREEFLKRVSTILETSAPRDPWYPGARQRYHDFTGLPAQSPQLAARLVRDIDPQSNSLFFDREPFTCVVAEVGLTAATAEEFNRRAVNFCNNTLWGTLSASMTVPDSHQKGRKARERLDELVASLRYGMVGINQWAGLNYILASPPWGGHPDSTLLDVQSGNARVHNTFLLDGVDQVVMNGPLTSFPRPAWFPSHPDPEPLAWALLNLYDQPGWKTLWKLIRST